jgi:large subunit ribosomal protein L5
MRGDDSLTMHKQISNELYKKYTGEVLPELKNNFNEKNYLALPQVVKVIVNMGVSKAKDDKNLLEETVSNMAAITGQQPVITKAKNSISNFALREGQPIGCRVTLRGKRMYNFIEKLLKIAIPRIRDFDGIKKSFDRFGNLTIGLTDETIFPEIDPDKIKVIKGLGITIVTDKNDKEQSVKLFELMGFPFVKQQ